MVWNTNIYYCTNSVPAYGIVESDVTEAFTEAKTDLEKEEDTTTVQNE